MLLADPSLGTQLLPDSREPGARSRLGPLTPEYSSEDVSRARKTDNPAALPPEPLEKKLPNKFVGIVQQDVVRTPTSSPPISQSRKRSRSGSSQVSQTVSVESESPVRRDLKRRRGRPPGSLNKKKSDASRNTPAVGYRYRASPTRKIYAQKLFQLSHTSGEQVPVPHKQHDPSGQHDQNGTGNSRYIGPRLYNFNYYRPDFEIERSVDKLGTASVIKRPLSRSRYEFEAFFFEEVQPLIRQAMKEYEGRLPTKDLLTAGRKVN